MNVMKLAYERMVGQLNADPTEAQIQAIRDVTARHSLTPEEFIRGVNAALDDPRGFFPRPGQFLAWARPPVKETESLSLAESAFEAISKNTGCQFGHVHPALGTVWDPEKVKSKLGPAAHAAFMAIGGNRQMKELSDWNLSAVRALFIKSYKDFVQDAPRLTGQDHRFLRPGKFAAGQEAEVAALLSGNSPA